MLRRAFLAVTLLCWSGAALGADIVDATGRTVVVPEQVARVLPAGPPAAVLLAALAPDLMLGWPQPLSPEARAYLSPEAARLPQVPRLTGHADVTAEIAALQPDLIVDYGTVSPRYSDLARTTRQRTGIPTILLDGSLQRIPQAFRTLGRALHREARAAVLADFAAALLALPTAGAIRPTPTASQPTPGAIRPTPTASQPTPGAIRPMPTASQPTPGAIRPTPTAAQPRPAGTHPRVLCARGADGLTVIAPDTDLAEVFTRLGWQVVAPPGQGPFRAATPEQVRALNPDRLVFSDPAMRATLAAPDWQALPAVRDGHALVAPALPFGWIEEPPSINRLLGLAWLSGRDPITLAAIFNAVVYGKVLTPAQLQADLAGVHAVTP